MKNKILNFFVLLITIFLLNSCFWYKIVKIEEIDQKKEKEEKIEEKKEYEPWSVWYRLHQQELEKQQNNSSWSLDLDKKEKTNSWSLEEEEKQEKKQIFLSKLADIEDFWEPIKKSNWVISSKNYNLFVFKDNSPILENIDRDNLQEFFTYHKDDEVEDLTKFIWNQYNIFYRNTARTIWKNKGFTYFVIHANKWNYIYEKHYIDLNNKLHWILFLDKWNLWETKNISEKLEKLKEKNTELKQITEFSEIPSANKIFSQIVQMDFSE
jgi:cell division protein FtsI/penicillin-binding protein 2